MSEAATLKPHEARFYSQDRLRYPSKYAPRFPRGTAGFGVLDKSSSNAMQKLATGSVLGIFPG